MASPRSCRTTSSRRTTAGPGNQTKAAIAVGASRKFAHERGSFESSQGAAKSLLAYYTEMEAPPGSINVTLNTVLAYLPPGMVATLWRAMARASGHQEARDDRDAGGLPRPVGTQ